MGTVFAIKRYAIHDGPDIRTTIFLKGCPLSCRWCHNPEGMEDDVSMLWLGERCVGCGECIEKCPTSSLQLSQQRIERRLQTCKCCGTCAVTCPALTHEATGQQATVAEIMAEIKKDIPFYDQSGGGVTFSGGEPLLQPDFLLALLQECGRYHIHRAVDTCAYAPAALLLEVARYTELFLIDLKHMDSGKHRQFTGVANEKILKNIRAISERGHGIRIRIPLIDGFNTDYDNMYKSGEFISSLINVEGVDLLPYHGAAAAKYTKLGAVKPECIALSQEKLHNCVRILTDMGLHVQIGG